jgi:hypothetical protein
MAKEKSKQRNSGTRITFRKFRIINGVILLRFYSVIKYDAVSAKTYPQRPYYVRLSTLAEAALAKKLKLEAC